MIKWLCRLSMATSYFWAIGYLIWKYTNTEVIEETHTTIALPILIMIILLTAIVGIGGGFILLLTWWDKIKEDKFSFYAFAPISALSLATIIIIRLMINKVSVLIEINTTQFMNDLSIYKGSTTVLLGILGVGTLLGAVGFIYEQKAQ